MTDNKGYIKDPTRSEEQRKERKRKVYGRRMGRPLRGDRKKAIEETLPEIEVNLDDLKTLDINNKNWLEIGFGNGEHLVWQSKHNPDVHYIGCEPFLNGVSACAKQIDDEDVTNARIWPDDARMVLENLPNDSLERIFLLHPDPWHKKRHHKRRFLQTEMLTRFAELMKKGAILRMASDDPSMAEWMLEKALNHPSFEWLATSADDWRKAKPDWPQTRYEAKGIEAGRKPYYLEFERL
ncbi:MAG: tRNA (guanosine(46)-N7)-methyltransferase TrmB [Rickettsiales bacterium]|nr:tRNA (guanosine(46)-N7)-methyltransferase TrmB [Rickettsiales bacterium]